jgi:hypothetical protein
MKLRYIGISLVLFMAFLSRCSWKEPKIQVPNTPESPPQLSIFLRPDKSIYRVNETIQASVKIVNNGSPLMINVRFAEQCLDQQDKNWEISFLIYDSMGQQYTSPRCIYVDYAEPWYQHLDKGSEYRITAQHLH